MAVLDVPFTYPVEWLNGIQLVDWGTEAPAWKKSTWPPELIQEVTARFGYHPLSGWYKEVPEDVNEFEDLYEKLTSGARKKGLISEYFLNQERWDLFLTVFAEPHWAAHGLWHIIDETHPDYNQEMA